MDSQAGDAGTERGLGLLPAETQFSSSKTLRQVTASCGNREWQAYEIQTYGRHAGALQR